MKQNKKRTGLATRIIALSLLASIVLGIVVIAVVYFQASI